MTKPKKYKHLEHNKEILGGSLVIKGTRLAISTVIHLLAKEASLKDILSYYDYLDIEQLQNALHECAEEVL